MKLNTCRHLHGQNLLIYASTGKRRFKYFSVDLIVSKVAGLWMLAGRSCHHSLKDTNANNNKKKPQTHPKI